MKPGAFFAVEGIEGSGKSTLARGLADRVSATGRDVLLTKEPGGTHAGIHLRQILLDADEPIDRVAETFLFLADRAHHVRSLVQPSLQRGMVVITDRYVLYSTIAYQGYARGMDLAELKKMNALAADGCLPSRVLFVDLPVETALARAKGRAMTDEESWNRFESEEISFHEKVRQGFKALAAEDPPRFAVLDGTQSPAQLLEAAFAIVQSSLG